MRNASPLTLLALAAGLALTGCSGDTPSSGAAGSSAASATPSASAEPTSTPSTSPSAPTAPTEEAQPGEPAGQEPPAAADQQHELPTPDAPEDTQVGAPAGGDRRNHPVERPGDLGGPAPSGDQLNYPVERPGDLSGPAPVAPVPPLDFDYDEAYSAWQSGMPYYEAFCIHYEPVTPAGLSQCHGTVAGTVDYVTGAYIGP